MTMTAAEIGHARPARSPNTKAALAYLIASGATAITVIEIDGACTIRTSNKIPPDAAAIFWISATQAKPIVKLARKLVGRTPDVDAATAALHEAANNLRIALTPHTTALSRARAAAERLDAYLESLRARGAMREFTKAYRRRRLAATACGEGFMSFAVAEARLRKALIPYLIGGRTIGPVQTLFEQIFDR